MGLRCRDEQEVVNGERRHALFIRGTCVGDRGEELVELRVQYGTVSSVSCSCGPNW